MTECLHSFKEFSRGPIHLELEKICTKCGLTSLELDLIHELDKLKQELKQLEHIHKITLKYLDRSEKELFDARVELSLMKENLER